jgi:hypothetical protein
MILATESARQSYGSAATFVFFFPRLRELTFLHAPLRGPDFNKIPFSNDLKSLRGVFAFVFGNGRPGI